MKSHIKESVMGDGAVGCSMLYHLTKHGQKDIVLIDHFESTSGFTWHVPGAFHTLNADTNMAGLYPTSRFMSVKKRSGLCNTTVQCVTYTGDFVYDIYLLAKQQRGLHEGLSEAGKYLGQRPFGMHAMMSLRIEKYFRSWMCEFRPDYTAVETGFGRIMSCNKPADLIDKQAVAATKAAGPERQLCTFVVVSNDADVWADDPIF